MADLAVIVPPPPPRCSVCGAPLRQGAIVCARCGAIPKLEFAADAIGKNLRRRLDRFGGLLHNRFLWLWVMALTPLVMAPPLAAFAYALFMSLRKKAPARGVELLHYAAIAAVALLNLRWSYAALTGAAAIMIPYLGRLPHLLPHIFRYPGGGSLKI